MARLKQEHTRVLNGFLDFAQESDGFSSVDETVVVCEGKVHHGANHNLKETLDYQPIISQQF